MLGVAPPRRAPPAPETIRQTRCLVVQPVAVREQYVVDMPNQLLVLANGLLEAARSRLFLALDEEDDVGLQRLCLHEVGDGVERGDDGALVVADAPTVQIAVRALQLEGLRQPFPLLRVGGYHVVVPVK